MTRYRCYFVNKEETVTGLEDVHAQSDREAKEKAQALLQDKPETGEGFELWRADKIVTREAPPKPRR
ncbi:MAG TPA: hypothetical protein VKY65_16140 [Alphaproteobacteria bacterium]|nr:hypothetical protein [Alphaproteobacteria bacterium]